MFPSRPGVLPPGWIERARRLNTLLWDTRPDEPGGTSTKTPQFMGVTVCGVDYNGL